MAGCRAMAIAKLLGFDLCPRLKALKDRHKIPLVLVIPPGHWITTPDPSLVRYRT
jgi:hypothetical protein